MPTCITDKEFQALKNKLSKGHGHTIATLDAGGSLLLTVEEGAKGLRRRWKVRYVPQPGKRTYKGLGSLAQTPRLKDARERAEALVRGLRNGVDIRKPSTASDTGKTVARLTDPWLIAVETQKDGRGENPKHFRGYFNKYVLPALGQLTPDEITPELVGNVLRSVDGKKSSVLKVFQAVEKFLKWCRSSKHRTLPDLVNFHKTGNKHL